MNKIKFHFINEWKIMKGKKLKTFTPFHFHTAWCSCGCHEVSLFFVIMSLGFFITINSTPVGPRVSVEEPEVDHLNEKSA